MPSPIKEVIDLVKDRELKQKALSDKVGSTAPIKISSAFIACKKCGRRALRVRWEEHFFVCPHCGNYAAIGAYYRLSMLYDAGTFQELDKEIEVRDPLSFPEYKEKVLALEKKTGLKEAVVSSKGKIGGMPVVVIVMDSRFLMGSMSDSVGEKITRGVEEADREHCPLIIFSASGGQNAGRHLQFDADGKDRSGNSALFRAWRTLYQFPDAPDNRRGYGELCDTGRHHPGRTRCTDRLCRAEGD